MIRRSFLIFPGIGEKRERLLWKAGVHDWDAYLARTRIPGIRAQAKTSHDALISRAAAALRERDLPGLAALFPHREQWRFYGTTAPRAGFVDIETTGTGPASPVTVVGVLDGGDGTFHQLVRGQDLDQTRLKALLHRFDILVTFNGTGFDLPILRGQYPGSVPAVPHLDLRTALARLGYTGGLKRIEVDLGLARPEALRGVDGYEAVLLWRRWTTRGDQVALDKLNAYNREDVVNMQGIAEFATAALHNKLCTYWGGMERTIPWPGEMPPVKIPREMEGVPGLVVA